MSSVDHLALGGQFALYMDIMIPIVDDDVGLQCSVWLPSRSDCLLLKQPSVFEGKRSDWDE